MKNPHLRKKEGFHGERSIFLPSAVIQQMEKDPVTLPLHITMIGYYPNAHNHYRERTETIDQYILIYCIEGTGYIQVGHSEWTLHCEQLIVLPAHAPHSYTADDKQPWTIYWLHFKGNLADYFAQGLNKPIDIKIKIDSRTNERISLFEEILTTMQHGYSKQNLHYATTVLYHFLGTIKYMEQFVNARMHESNKDDLVETAILYMKENMEKRVSMSDVARFIGYSSSHFCQVFKEKTGMSPNDYFNRLKIERACELLDQTNMRINQISYKIGIQDNYYFSRLFKKVMHVSPQKYRKDMFAHKKPAE